MVRRLCTAAAADGIDNELTRRFVRNLKSSQEEQLQSFKLAAADIWAKQVGHCCRSLLSCTAVVHCCRALDPTPYIRLRLCPCVYILLCECYTGSCACLCDQTSRVGCFLEAAFYAYDRQHADQYFPIVSSFCIVSTPYELRVLFPKDFFLQLHL